jgi:hypothetical protein
MKKLLFLISIPLLTLSFSCGNKKTVVNMEDKTTSGQKHEVNSINSSNDSIPVGDTIVKRNKGQRRDKFEAPNHGSPDLQKIDSIKAAGAKGKNN